MRLISLSFAFALALGCGASDTTELPGPGNGPDDGSGDNGDNPGGPDAPPDPGVCGEQSEEIELINLGDPPDVLIVLDRSGSMDGQPTPDFGTFPDPFGPTKWQIMKDALTELTNSKNQNINFGLTLFPTDASCDVTSTALVNPKPLGAADVQSELGNWEPDGGTPAAAGLSSALTAYQGLPVNPEGQYVIFATDGSPNCADEGHDADDDTVAAVTALANAGIDTFVIGFGGGFAGTDSVLNDAAQAGGFPKAGGPPYYYEADNAQELNTALQDIAGGIITPSCSYELASAPPEPDNVTVLADGQPVPRSEQHTNGWDYHPDDKTITFFGSYCSDIESATIQGVDFVFGCKGPQID